MNRRRFISLTAATSALALTGPLSASTRAQAITWQGVALGATASMTLMIDDRAQGQKIIGEAMGELQRLEKIFSIYDPRSELSVLNRTGILDAPSHDLLALLSLVQDLHARTEGLFDPTVQPLYRFYHNHPGAPPRHRLNAIRERIGFEKVSITASKIKFGAPGMAMTLNGIAQGYITDRIAGELRRAGFRNILLNLGEIRANGRRGRDDPWRIAIENPLDPARPILETNLENRAVATSASSKTNHLLDPHSGLSANRFASLSVFASSAARADGLSTAFSLASWPEVERRAARFSDIAVIAQLKSGERQRLYI